MARDEQDRENLLAEATALVERVELYIPGDENPVVVGFRGNGGASFFFGADPVYQFNGQGRLRRAFVDGLLLKAMQKRLVALRRERTATEVTMFRSDLNAEETEAFLRRASERLSALATALAEGKHRVAGCFPPDADMAARARSWLVQYLPNLELADSPQAGK